LVGVGKSWHDFSVLSGIARKIFDLVVVWYFIFTSSFLINGLLVWPMKSVVDEQRLANSVLAAVYASLKPTLVVLP